MLLQDQEKSSNKDPKESTLIKKESQDSKQQGDTALLQYNIQKLLAESASREEKYINFIKQQKEKLFEVTQKYADIMLQYKKQIKQFINKKQADKSAKRFEKVHAMVTKVPPNKYEKKQYTIQSQYELDCKIKFSYIIPALDDYFKQIFPHHFFIEFTQYYPSREFKCFQVQLNPEIDEQERMERMKNKYPIQMYSPNMNLIMHSFMISHFSQKFEGEKILKYYRQNQIQFMLRNKQSQLLFGYGKIDLEQLLQFSENETISLQKIPVMSIEVGDKIIAFINIQMTNTAIPKTMPKQHVHKISQPLSINRQQIKFYKDKQTRIIQRINQYKNIHHSVIPAKDKDSDDKNLLMHQKRKELEQIQSYKEAHKEEYMQKIFGQAIQQYHTQHIQIGECKYIPFIYSNHSDKHQKAKIKLSHRLIREQNSEKNQIKMQLKNSQEQESMSIEIVDSAIVGRLIKEQIISYNAKLQNCNMDYSIDDDYVFVVNGESIVIYVKVICHTLKINCKYQICVDLKNDFGEDLHNDMIILKTYEPIPNHIFPIYTYIGQINQIKIQTPSFQSNRGESSLVGKTKIANIIGNNSLIQLQSNWLFGYEVLELKIKGSARLQNNKIYSFYVLVYDIDYTVKLATYQLVLECMDKIEQQAIDLGRTNVFNVKLKFPPLEGSAMSPKLIIKLASSDYLNGYCKLRSTSQNSKQFLVERNTQYPITISYNTFVADPPTQKLIICCIDASTSKAIKKLVLPLKKNSITFKHVYKLVCRENVLTFNHELICNYKEQTTYKLYSSNYSLMTIPEDTIVLFPNQVKSAKLQFRYWEKEISNTYENPTQRSVILSVDDGVNVSLYLFQLQNDENS